MELLDARPTIDILDALPVIDTLYARPAIDILDARPAIDSSFAAEDGTIVCFCHNYTPNTN